MGKSKNKLYFPVAAITAIILSLFCCNSAWADVTLAADSDGNASEFSAVLVADELSNPITDNFNWDNMLPALKQETVSKESIPALASAIAEDVDTVYDTVKEAVDETKIITITSEQEPIYVKSGWYIIYGDDATMIMTLVNHDMTLKLKNYAPILIKEVNKNGTWSHEAIFGEGESIPYRIVATLPEGYSQFTEYNITFQDEWDAALAIDPTSVKVSIVHDGQETDITKLAESIVGTTNLSVDIANLRDTEAADNDQVIVTYTMQLTSAALSGTKGMENTAYLEYPRRPDTKSRDKTVIDKTKVMTLQLIVSKINEKSRFLECAEFTLTDKDGSFIAADGTRGKEQVVYKTDKLGLVKNLPLLDEGTYTITETKAPEGYILPDNASTTVELSLTTNSENKYVLDAKAQGLGNLEQVSADSGTATLVVVNKPDDGVSSTPEKDSTPTKITIPDNPISRTYTSLKGGTIPKLGDAVASILIIGVAGGAIAFAIAAARKRRNHSEK